MCNLGGSAVETSRTNPFQFNGTLIKIGDQNERRTAEQTGTAFWRQPARAEATERAFYHGRPVSCRLLVWGFCKDTQPGLANGMLFLVYEALYVHRTLLASTSFAAYRDVPNDAPCGSKRDPARRQVSARLLSSRSCTVSSLFCCPSSTSSFRPPSASVSACVSLNRTVICACTCLHNCCTSAWVS